MSSAANILMFTDFKVTKTNQEKNSVLKFQSIFSLGNCVELITRCIISFEKKLYYKYMK
jgi:hypothetical protein